MKFEVLQEELAKGLGLVSRVVANRPQLAVLANILIEAKADGLLLSATDLELGMGVKVNAKVLENGITTVPAKSLYEFVSSVNPGKVEVQLDKETIVVASGAYRGKFQTISAEEFPKLPEESPENESASVPFEELSRAVQMVAFASAKDSLRPVLTGVLLELKKSSLSLVATDGFRLAIRKVVAEGNIDEQKALLVPMRALSELARAGVSGKVKIMHAEKANQVIFSVGELKVVTQMIEGTYPDYNKIVPKEFVSESTLLREELLQAVKASYIFARDNSNMMRWDVAEKILTVTAETPERGEAAVEVSIANEGDAGKVVFNAKYVMDFLSASSSEQITFGMGEPLAPCAFREQGNQDFLYVVMPINA